MTVIATAPMRLAAAALALGLGTAPVLAQDLKVMAPAAPGGGWDTTARELQKSFTTSGAAKSVAVSNVPGAGGTIGLAQFVNGAKGDGNAMMVGGLVMVGAILTNKSAVNLSQVTPLARLTGEWEAIVVPAASPHKALKDLVAALKADPGKVAVGGGSAGGTDHITLGLLAKQVGADPTKINYVPYSGGGALVADLLSANSRLAAGISSWSEFEAQVKAGKLRSICVTAPKKVAEIDAPSCKEAGVDLVLANWRSIFGPPGLSDAQKKAQLASVDKAVKSAAWKETLKQKNWDDQYLAGDAFAKFLKEDEARVTAILKSIGLVK